ncbi:MAG: acyl-CoA thioesterase [Pirellulaceae bacterium]|nr:acyl-CoA thioesterase [Pirellulaceae bacterium]
MTFTTERRIEFRDTDAAGIVHFSTFFPMMEAAEHEMLRGLGIPVLDHADPNQLTWPRVSATCDYLAAARFEDILSIAVSVSHIGTSSIQYTFEFTRDQQPIARGQLTVVCCRLRPGGGLEKAPIPDPIRQLLAKYK